MKFTLLNSRINCTKFSSSHRLYLKILSRLRLNNLALLFDRANLKSEHIEWIKPSINHVYNSFPSLYAIESRKWSIITLPGCWAFFSLPHERKFSFNAFKFISKHFQWFTASERKFITSKNYFVDRMLSMKNIVSNPITFRSVVVWEAWSKNVSLSLRLNGTK